MMSIDLSDQMPLPLRVRGTLPRRAAPCAGLFGWRKDGGDSRAGDKGGKAPGRDYPAG